jgi:hypothetical protein
MPLFPSKNRKIGEQLEKQTRKVVDLPTGPLNQKDVCEYFMKVGTDHKGDLQSYMYNKGSTKTVELKIDLVALAAACAGCPVPETPLIAEVGTKISVTNLKSNLVVAYVAPKELKCDEREMAAAKSLVFLGLTGYRWSSTVEVSAELGVKTPSIPGTDFQGGGWSDKKAEVSSGTYAEVCAFDLSAKASIQAKAGVTGDRMYLSDPCPTYLARSTGSTSTEINKLLTSVLEHGDKKEIIKQDTLKFLEAHGKKMERSWIKKHITGGQVTTDSLLEALHEVEATIKDKPNELAELQHHIRALTDYRAAKVLGPYSFVSLWSVKPEASAGMSAEAKASFKVNALVGGFTAEAGVTVTGPSVSTSLKFSYYRLQIATAADSKGGVHKLVRKDAKRDLLSEAHTPSQYIIMSQDTKITYGQIDFTIIGIEGKLELSAQQDLIDVKNPKLQKGKEGKLEKEKGLFSGSLSGEAKLGLGKTGVGVKGEAKLKKALNYIFYDSAVAYWIPPAEAGTKKGQERPVTLARGSGYAFGQSVDIGNLQEHITAFASGKGSIPYFTGLANAIGVTLGQMMRFINQTKDLIGDLAGAGENVKPSAFLIESSFAPALPTYVVPARWMNERWILGPFHLGWTLRDVLIPKKINPADLQAIRLRYRLGDTQREDKKRFSLGFKYIVTVGVAYTTVEEAGSEGIVNYSTVWFNKFSTYNKGSQAEASEAAVPQVALIHQ